MEYEIIVSAVTVKPKGAATYDECATTIRGRKGSGHAHQSNQAAGGDSMRRVKVSDGPVQVDSIWLTAITEGCYILNIHTLQKRICLAEGSYHRAQGDSGQWFGLATGDDPNGPETEVEISFPGRWLRIANPCRYGVEVALISMDHIDSYATECLYDRPEQDAQ